MNQTTRLSLAMLGPGMLVAATGVGAGDLATASFTGAHLGTAVLWAVIVGAAFKYVLNEGLTRWQLATGTTLLEGTITHLGVAFRWIFLAYLIVWSYLVAMALMSACGVTAQAIIPIVADPNHGKIIFGALHSLLAAILVLIGGFRLFEKIMGVCIALMFFTVCGTALLFLPSFGELLTGMLVPRIPRFYDGGLAWTVALLGGVGGTVTVLCYGYWIREVGRTSPEDLPVCRVDLAVGYAMTAIFGLAMVLIGSRLGQIDSQGASLIVRVAETLEGEAGRLGSLVKWSFLVGAWGAVFSSLLGVWQSIPYLYVDFWRLIRRGVRDDAQAVKINASNTLYRYHLAAMAIIPISGVFLLDFSTAMKAYGVVGAIFIPMLALVLLRLNGQSRLVGPQHKNSNVTATMLVLAMVFFVFAGALQILGR